MNPVGFVRRNLWPLAEEDAPPSRWLSAAVGMLVLTGRHGVAALPRVSGPGEGMGTALLPFAGPMAPSASSAVAQSRRAQLSEASTRPPRISDVALDALVYGDAPGAPAPLPIATAGAPRPAAAGITTVPLTGCPDSRYVADVIVGKTQIATVSIDLTTSTLLLPDRSCRSCSNPWGYTINDSLGAELTGINISVAGTDYTATAEVLFDEVTFPGVPSARSTRLAIGIVEAQQGFFRPNRCGLAPTALGAFSPGPAVPTQGPRAGEPGRLGPILTYPTNAGDNQLYQNPPDALYRGVFGLGLGPTLPPDVKLYNASWLDVFESILPTPQIALAVCDRNGTLFLGGYPTQHVVAPPFFTPMQGGAPFGVALSYIGLGDQSSVVDGVDIGYMRFNTDAPHMRLPTDAFAALVGNITAQANGVLPEDFFWAGQCRFLGNVRGSDLSRQLPNLTIGFLPGPSAVAPSLTLPATGSYLEIIVDAQGREVGVCPRLGEAVGGDASWGLSAMRGLLLVVDGVANQAGFAVSRGVC